jgi:hypothetical protein
MLWPEEGEGKGREERGREEKVEDGEGEASAEIIFK